MAKAPTSLVSRSMYTVPQTTSQAMEAMLLMRQDTSDAEHPSRACRWCGKPIIKPRHNQQCCCAECRTEWERSKRIRRKQAAAEKPKGICLWCDGEFDKVRQQQDFCCPDHQQAFNNFWKGRGPALAKALHAWRIGKVEGGLTKVCREFSAARQELKCKRALVRKKTSEN